MSEKRSSGTYSWRKTFLGSIAIICLLLLSLAVFSRGKLILAAYAATFGILIFFRKKEFFAAFALSTILGILWTYYAQNLYHYNNPNVIFMGMNMFTLVAYSVGMLATYAIYYQFQQKLSFQSFFQQFFLFCAIYWVLLIPFDWLGYHKFNIHNLATASYPALRGFNCLRAPRFMQIAYFSFGPLFFILLNILNPRYYNKIIINAKQPFLNLFSDRENIN